MIVIFPWLSTSPFLKFPDDLIGTLGLILFFGVIAWSARILLEAAIFQRPSPDANLAGIDGFIHPICLDIQHYAPALGGAASSKYSTSIHSTLNPLIQCDSLGPGCRTIESNTNPSCSPGWEVLPWHSLERILCLQFANGLSSLLYLVGLFANLIHINCSES